MQRDDNFCLKWYIYIYIFEKQVKRIMSETYNNPRVFEDGKSYRVWSLTRQGFLRLTTNKDGDPSVECSGTGEEDSSNTETLIIVISWVPNFL